MYKILLLGTNKAVIDDFFRQLVDSFEILSSSLRYEDVMKEMRSMFLCEGMNDFLAKPIELPVLVSKLRQWLPKEKKQIISPEERKILA